MIDILISKYIRRKSIIKIDISDKKITTRKGYINYVNYKLVSAICSKYRSDGINVRCKSVDRKYIDITMEIIKPGSKAPIQDIRDHINEYLSSIDLGDIYEIFFKLNPMIDHIRVKCNDIKNQNIFEYNGSYYLCDIDDFYFLAYDNTGNKIHQCDLAKTAAYKGHIYDKPQSYVEHSPDIAQGYSFEIYIDHEDIIKYYNGNWGNFK